MASLSKRLVRETRARVIRDAHRQPLGSDAGNRLWAYADALWDVLLVLNGQRPKGDYWFPEVPQGAGQAKKEGGG